MHRERIFLAYAVEISQGLNLKQLPHVSSKTVKNYLKAAASHATDNGAQDPRFRYTPSGSLADGNKYFPSLHKLLNHMKKWAKGKSEALPLTPAILHRLHSHSVSSGKTSAAACIFDAICIGLQTGSRCREYCRGNPTENDAPFSRVPFSHYAAEFAGYPLAFVPDDVSFLDASLHFIPPDLALSQAEFVQIRFKFDKGGTGNLSCCTFKRSPKEKSTFCPLLAATRALAQWKSHNLSPLMPLFCYTQNGSACFIQDTTVTKHLRDAAILAYPKPSHIYRCRLADVRTHSL